MPLVDLECPQHGQQEAFVRKLQGSLIPCPLCNRASRRLWTSHSLGQVIEFRAGYDRMLWRNFNTKAERDDYLRKENLTKVG